MEELEEDTRFVIMGDYNADPNDGDATDDPITSLFFANSLIKFDATEGEFVPFSLGGIEAALTQGGGNDNHISNPAFDTADFGEPTPGNLRVDYVLPSANIRVKNSGVFWPEANDPLSQLLGSGVSSDHQLFFVDVRI